MFHTSVYNISILYYDFIVNNEYYEVLVYFIITYLILYLVFDLKIYLVQFFNL